MEDFIQEYGSVVVFVALGGFAVTVISFSWEVIGEWMIALNNMLVGG